MLAYLFFHWRVPSVASDDYEARLRHFHLTLAAGPSAGFSNSYCLAVHGAPWANQGGDSYEDWYLLSGSAALDPLNEAAVTAGRKVAHDDAAVASAGGTAGLYSLRLGSSEEPPRFAYWFAKPHAASYADLYEAMRPLVRSAGGALWARQMTFGPAREFCLHAQRSCALPSMCEPLEIPLRTVWPLDDA